MIDFLAQHYVWIKALHLFAVMSWMAGMLYLPRLFAYHADAAPGSDKSETFKVMEVRLLRIIINPAMIATWVLGLTLIATNPDLMKQGWMHAKFALVIGMSGLHGVFSRWRKNFAADRNAKSARFYRLWNEAPALLMLVIIILAVAKPF